MEYARLEQNGEIFFAQYQNGYYYRLTGDCLQIQSVASAPVNGAFRLLAPVIPSKIVALGLNYKKHAAEMREELKQEPLLFLKPPSAILNPGETICIACPEHRTDYEAELAVIIGKRCRNISAREAKDYIFGYSCGNDVSDRILQAGDGQWTRAKGFDSYCPLGPHIVTGIEPQSLRVETVLNGKVVQCGNTADMITGVFEAVSFISKVMTLEPFDVIMTGTPDGIGPLHAGDTVEIRIESVGSLVNPVANRDA